MSIVFGSPEAQAILQRDKQEARQAEIDKREEWLLEDDTKSKTLKELEDRLKSIDREIDHLQWEIEDLEMERGDLENAIAEVKKNQRKTLTVEQWNAWAKGEMADLAAFWPAMPDLKGGVDLFAEYPVSGEPTGEQL